MPKTLVSVNSSISPELQEFIDKLGEFNASPVAQVVSRLAVTHVVENQETWEAWKKFASSEGFGEKSWKTALKFFWAAHTSLTTAASVFALREAKKKIEGVVLALGR